MPDLTLYLSFLIVSAALIVVPGPNVLLIIATSIAHGRARGLWTVAGTSSAMILQLMVAAGGTLALANLLADAFVWVKWIGVAYLAWLGVQHLRAAMIKEHVQKPVSRNSTFWRGFMVSLTNPKTIVFFAAFLPQFVSSTAPVAPQLLLLSASFLILATLLDSCYAILAGSLKHLGEQPRFRQWQNGITGLLFTGAAVGLSLTRR